MNNLISPPLPNSLSYTFILDHVLALFVSKCKYAPLVTDRQIDRVSTNPTNNNNKYKTKSIDSIGLNIVIFLH